MCQVLLTGGAIQSPHLLMLSGVGPAQELQAVGVESKIDLPAVGSNLQDHPAVGAWGSWACMLGVGLMICLAGPRTDFVLILNPPPHTPIPPPPVVAHNITKPLSVTDKMFLFKDKVNPRHLLRWALTGTGILTTPGCDHGAFVKTDPALPEPDLQVRA